MAINISIFVLWCGFCVFWIWLKTRDIKRGVTGSSGVAIERAKSPVKFWLHYLVNVLAASLFAGLAAWFLLRTER